MSSRSRRLPLDRVERSRRNLAAPDPGGQDRVDGLAQLQRSSDDALRGWQPIAGSSQQPFRPGRWQRPGLPGPAHQIRIRPEMILDAVRIVARSDRVGEVEAELATGELEFVGRMTGRIHRRDS